MARGGLKSLIPAINLDTLRGRRKGDPQHDDDDDEQLKYRQRGATTLHASDKFTLTAAVFSQGVITKV